MEDIDLLVEFFFKGQDEDDEELIADPADIITLVGQFVAAKEELRIAEVSPVKRKKRLLSEDAEIKARRRREEKKFWQRLSHVIPAWRANAVYAILQKASHKLLRLLRTRDDSLRVCQGVRKRLDELNFVRTAYKQIDFGLP
jgi:hypothetical protein